MGKNVHVVTHEAGWAAKKEGGRRASVVTPTKEAATDAGRRIAKREGSELILHKRNGQIHEKNSYGRDPYPPKG